MESNATSFDYTMLIELGEIPDKQWGLLKEWLPVNVAGDKKAFLGDLKRLNSIRNKLMHPLRSDHVTDDEFDFARQLYRRLHRDNWRSPPATTTGAQP